MNRSLAIINIIFLTAAVYLGVDSFYKIVPLNRNYALPLQKSHQKHSPRAAASKRSLAQYDLITDRNLFNANIKPVKAAAPAKIEPEKVEKLKPTGLKLKLWGTVSNETSPEGHAYAVIEEAGRSNQQLYKAGDRIQDAIIKAILRKKVVLNVDGRDEVLEMEKMQEGPQAKAGPRADSEKTAHNVNLKRNQLEAVVKDVNSLLKQVRILPHFQNGKSEGLRLMNIKPDSFFAQMGLKNNDIMTGVNGQPIETVDDALLLYQSLKDSDNVSLQLQRKGRQETIEYDIE